MVNRFAKVIRVMAGVLTHPLSGTGVRATTISLLGRLRLDLPLAQAAIDDFSGATLRQSQARHALVRTDGVDLL